MKKFVVALLTSVFFLLVAAKSAEAIGCTPTLFNGADQTRKVLINDPPISGLTVPPSVPVLWVAYPITPEEAKNGSTPIPNPGIHWCWKNTEGAQGGATACSAPVTGVGTLGSQYLDNVDFYTDGTGQNYIAGRFSPYNGTQTNTQWEVAAWQGGGGLSGWGDQACQASVISTGDNAAYSCSNPGTSTAITKTGGDVSVHVGINVDASHMDPSRSYRAMIKGEGARDFGGGWSIDLIKDGENYEGASTFTQGGDHFGDGDYTVVIADTSNVGCNVITDNFDIRNCQVFPQCISRLTVKADDPTKQIPYEDRDKVIDQAADNRVSPDVITPFSLCRQIPVLTSSEIQAQVSQVKDAKKAAALEKELKARALTQQDEKSQCCQCMYGTRFFDKNTGACQGESGTTGATNPSIARQRAGFKQGIYTAVGCIGADSESIVTRLVRIGLGIAGGVALLMILTGAFMFTTSQGEPKRASEAKELITSAVLGLIFIVFSVTLLQFIGVNILHIPGFGSTDTTGAAVNQKQ